jgi:hypothetical protein
MVFFCLLAAGANWLLSWLCRFIGVSLFLDTLFTLMVTFLRGPVWGCLCAVFTTLVLQIVDVGMWPYSLFVVCGIAGVILTWLFTRSHHIFDSKDEEDGGGFNRVTLLLILSLHMCILMSVLGGLIAFLIPILWPSTAYVFSVISYYKLGLLLNGLPALAAEIISRFPVNIPDRLLSVFGAYGLAWVFRKTRSLIPGKLNSARFQREIN